MTNGSRFIDQAAQRAQALPLARIVAVMLGVSAAFFALAMPPRIVGGLFGLTGLSLAIGQPVFAILFAILVAAIGWLSLTLIAGTARPAPTVKAARRPAAAAKSGDPAPTLRRGDAHPDAPPRRPIFAKDDLGTPFDEIITDRRIIHSAPEAEFTTPDAPVELNGTVVRPPAAAVAPEAPVAAAADAPEELVERPDPRAAVRPAPPRDDDSIAALMARFEGGLGRLGGDTPPPPDLSSLEALKRAARNPDDALRDALESLQQMAARQR